MQGLKSVGELERKSCTDRSNQFDGFSIVSGAFAHHGKR